MIFRSRVQRMFPVVVAACLAGLSWLDVPAMGQVFQKSEDFTTNPGWDEFANRIVPQDFGYSATNIAGGTIGEAGGRFVRATLAMYADNVGALDPSDTTLRMTGTGILTGEDDTPNGNLMIGWFDKFSDLHWEPDQPDNFIGFRNDEQSLYLSVSGVGFNFRVNPELIDMYTPFTYDLTYDPTGNGGNGSLSGTFEITSGGVLETVHPTLDFPAGIKDSFNDLNRFGLFTLWIPGSENTAEFFFDDITYTASPPLPGPSDYNWNLSGGGNWKLDASWDWGFLPPTTATAVLGSAISRPSTVFTETALAVNGVRFDNANPYVIAGNGNVTTTSVEVVLGDHVFQLPVNLGPSANVDVATNTSLTFENALNLGGNAATKTGGGTMLVNNALFTGGGSVDVQGGTLGGVGTVGGNLSSSGGSVAPGENAGLLAVSGNYTQDATSSLQIEIGGLVSEDQYDVLAVTGTADLAGTLAISLIDGFTPTAGQQFTVLTSSGITNSGLSLSGPDASMFSLDVGASSVILNVGIASLAGDYNGDGTVNAADYTRWQDTLGQNVTAGSAADGNGDGTIDASDYGVWKTNFGTTSGLAAASGAAVPEPTNLVLLCTGLIGLWTWLGTGGKVMRCGLRGRVFLMALAVGVVSIGAAGSAHADLKVEMFDGDPHWDGLNNRGLYQDFGVMQVPPFFVATHFAEGTNTGEIGGYLVTDSPAHFPAYLADDVGGLDPSTDALAMAGKGVIRSHSSPEGGFHFFGWFDKDSDLTHVEMILNGETGELEPTQNFMHFIGLRTDDDRVMLYSDGESTTINRPGMSNPFTFSFNYDPNANGGDGAVMGSVDGGNTFVRNLAPGTKDLINDLDSFGMLADENQNPEVGSRTSEWYWDDLVYTTNIAQPPITEVAWSSDYSGDGNSGASWNPPVPPTYNGVTVVLGDVITSPRTIFADTDLTMKTLRIDNANAYVMAGNGTLNLEADTGNATIEVLQGGFDAQMAVSLGSHLNVTVAAGSTITFNNGLDLNGFTLNKLGDGDLVINNALTLGGGLITGLVINNVVGVPEPSTVVMLGLAVVAFGPAVLRKRCRTK